MNIQFPFLGEISLFGGDRSGPRQRMLLVSTGPRATWARVPEILDSALRQASSPARAWLTYPDAATTFSAGGILRQPVRPTGSFHLALRDDSAVLNLKDPHPDLNGRLPPADPDSAVDVIEGTARVVEAEADNPTTVPDAETVSNESDNPGEGTSIATAEAEAEADEFEGLGPLTDREKGTLRMLGFARVEEFPESPWTFPDEAKRRYDLRDRAQTVEHEQLSKDPGSWLVKAVGAAIVLGAVALGLKFAASNFNLFSTGGAP